MGLGADTQSWWEVHAACEQHSGSSQSVRPSEEGIFRLEQFNVFDTSGSRCI